jgi:hypothetical protein
LLERRDGGAGYPAGSADPSVEPLENVDLMNQLRNNPERETNIASGPGKLCMAMSIDKQLNGANLLGTTIWIEDRKLDLGRSALVPELASITPGTTKTSPGVSIWMVVRTSRACGSSKLF